MKTNNFKIAVTPKITRRDFLKASTSSLLAFMGIVYLPSRAFLKRPPEKRTGTVKLDSWLLETGREELDPILFTVVRKAQGRTP